MITLSMSSPNSHIGSKHCVFNIVSSEKHFMGRRLQWSGNDYQHGSVNTPGPLHGRNVNISSHWCWDIQHSSHSKKNRYHPRMCEVNPPNGRRMRCVVSSICLMDSISRIYDGLKTREEVDDKKLRKQSCEHLLQLFMDPNWKPTPPDEWYGGQRFKIDPSIVGSEKNV